MKANKFLYLYILQGFYSYGWEDLTAEDSFKEAREQRKCYRENAPGTAYRIIRRREVNPEAVAVAVTLEGAL